MLTPPLNVTFIAFTQRESSILRVNRSKIHTFSSFAVWFGSFSHLTSLNERLELKISMFTAVNLFYSFFRHTSKVNKPLPTVCRNQDRARLNLLQDNYRNNKFLYRIHYLSCLLLVRPQLLNTNKSVL